MRPLTEGRRLAQVIGATLLAGGLVVSAAGIAAADVDATPAGPPNVVVDLDSYFDLYPTVPIPSGCDAGAGFLVGASLLVTRARWSAAGATAPRARDAGPSAGCSPGDMLIDAVGLFALRAATGEASVSPSP